MIYRKNHVTRLSKYKMVVKRMRALGMNKVFSENLADALGFTASQVRKDFSIFGITGRKKGGYQIEELLEDFDRLLGKEETRDAVIVGYGNLGRAMARYPGFEKERIRIRAAFDVDKDKLNPDAQVPVYAMDKLSDFIRKHDIKLAILAVPNTAVQDVLNQY
ncbi:MAG: redox-sensing transcriptional repressor Rex [candidate division KSB1 bacterium]|nr:redox-sensing transcriptional repressor Rex [candidate division KSB1 bacterium]